MGIREGLTRIIHFNPEILCTVPNILIQFLLRQMSFVVPVYIVFSVVSKDTDRDINAGPWRCLDYIAKKAPCQAWQKYQSERGFTPNPFAVLTDTSEKREVAL